MSLLQTLGKIFITGEKIVEGILGVAQQEFPGIKGEVQIISKDLAQIANAIVQVESFGQILNTPGVDKLKAVVPAVSQVVMASAMLAGRKISDQPLFLRGCTKVADGIADILNSADAHVETDTKV